MTRLYQRQQHSMPRPFSPLRDFLRTEAAGGVLLVIAAVIAMTWANSPWSSSYEDVWTTPIAITIGDHSLHLIARQWINEGLLTIFFFVVGLEIKRELARGQLSSMRAALLPVAAAVGGMVAPALIYLAIAGDTAPRCWAIVVATDVPLALGVRRHWVYVALGCLLWLMLHQAGLSATLAGVAMALLAPSTPRIAAELVDSDALADVSNITAARETTDIARGSVSVVEWLEHLLHPWASYIIIHQQRSPARRGAITDHVGDHRWSRAGQAIGDRARHEVAHRGATRRSSGRHN